MLILDATNLNRFMRCNGSRLMAVSPAAMSTDDTARDEGIAAHWLAQMVFTGQHSIVELIDRKAPNGIYISAEMAEFVSEYLHAIVDRPTQFAEMEVDTTCIGLNWQVNGRADHISLSTDGETLHIDDFKFGWRIVEPETNWTLIWHAIGWLKKRGISVSKIIFSIHQPRPHHIDGKVRSWEISNSKLADLQSELLNTLINPSDLLVTSYEHCGKCPSITNCPASQKATMNAVDVSEMAFNDDVNNEQLAYELDILTRAGKAITDRLKASEELAQYRIKSGAVIENYSLETTLGNRNWKPEITVDVLTMLTGKDISEKKLPTPAQAEKKGLAPETVKALTERKQTGTKLTRVKADTKAKRIFGEK